MPSGLFHFINMCCAQFIFFFQHFPFLVGHNSDHSGTVILSHLRYIFFTRRIEKNLKIHVLDKYFAYQYLYWVSPILKGHIL